MKHIKSNSIIIYILPHSSPNIPSPKCGGPVVNSHAAGCHMGPSSSGRSEWGHTGLQGINSVPFSCVATNQPNLHHAFLIFVFSLKNVWILHFWTLGNSLILFIDLFLGVSAPEWDGAPAYSVPAGARGEA